jgi:hypothetical protein
MFFSHPSSDLQSVVVCYLVVSFFVVVDIYNLNVLIAHNLILKNNLQLYDQS